MHRRAVLLALCFPMLSTPLRAAETTGDVELNFPLRIATLGDPAPSAQVGKAIVVSDLADADKQISTILLSSLQGIGLAIESPPLDLEHFLLPKQEWRSNVRELDADWIAAHNRFAGAPPLPGSRFYAVQYAGRYEYAGSMLRIVLGITLFEHGARGPLHPLKTPYSRQFFADKLESAIQAQLAGAKRSS